jgi:hypothetical protein
MTITKTIPAMTQAQIANMNDAVFSYLKDNVQYATDFISEIVDSEQFAKMMWSYYNDECYSSDSDVVFDQQLFHNCASNYFDNVSYEFYRVDQKGNESICRFFENLPDAKNFAKNNSIIQKYQGLAPNTFGWHHGAGHEVTPGQIIKYMRNFRHLSQAELAEKSGISRARISQLENAENAEFNTVKLLAEKMDFEVQVIQKEKSLQS